MVPSFPPHEVPPPVRPKKPDKTTEWGCGSALGVLLWLGLAGVVHSFLWGDSDDPSLFIFDAIIAGAIVLVGAACLAGLSWIWRQLTK
jgi:protein-S-isoprenylcysteine O-methyltransferase Ste14